MVQGQSDADFRTEMVWVPVDSIQPNPSNPRLNDDAVPALVRSIGEFGFRQPIVVNRQTNLIEAGNTRWKAAKQLGLTEISVVFVDDDDLTATQFAIADNRTHEFSTWDDPVLAAQLERLAAEDGLAATGFNEQEMVELLASLDAKEKAGREESWRPPTELPEGPTRVQPGEVWQLGRHRLLCGDCTVAENWERLMAGRVAHAITTDPPYAVQYKGGTHGTGGTRDFETGEDHTREDAYWDDMSTAEYLALLEKALTLAHRFSDDKAPIYLWFASVNIRQVLAALDGTGWQERTFIAWVKNVHAGNLWAQYKYKMEPMYYAHKKGQAPRWHGPTNEVNVWEHDKASVNDLHPTMKPVALIERTINNATTPGQLVVDPFLGSGTAIIAAERTGRTCYGFDLDARYCDVILSRWESFAGQQAEKGGPDL